jgi:ATP-dependent DNA helicase PIF1
VKLHIYTSFILSTCLQVIVFTGDFRQVLPVVPRGSRAQIVGASLKKSVLWEGITVLHLTENMRAQILLRNGAANDAAHQQAWADDLLRVGDGLAGNPYQVVDVAGVLACLLSMTPSLDEYPTPQVPLDMQVRHQDGSPASLEDLIQDVYGDVHNDPSTRQEASLISRCILTPKNDTTMEINDQVTSLFPGIERRYLSADTTKEVDDQVSGVGWGWSIRSVWATGST